ncbi:MMPL/RND family transporter [Gordonia crocea]|uniref:Putative membrane protein MmpL n=1 Tax=Gordonia crocea TaxID=589162 RepID=A0A7I9V1K0_9ACTN|nr:RND family transporter [Gordonia crocea]GED98669.1 putative membrane protein MmpL [Gordonia crocea]GED99285.1 putative membrane protein MmpL [Gordonia crocea]
MTTTADAPAARPRFARFLYRFSAPVIGAWLLLIVVLNLAVPQLESVVIRKAQSFLPDSASSVQALTKMGTYFGSGERNGGGSNNFVYLLLEGQDRLGSDAKVYYQNVLQKLTSDTTHVSSAMDLWSDPDLAPVAESNDGKVAYALVNLHGNMGTALAMESTRVARETIAATSPPPGVQVHLTGPSAVVNDEMIAIADSMFLLVALSALLVTVILLIVYRSPITAAVPLLTVGAGLAVARSTIAVLAELNLLDVSIFAAALSAVVVLGAGTNYGIFLLGRYQENRRKGLSPEDSYYAALAGVQHIIIASALTVAGAMACLTATRLSMFSTAGLPCTIAIIVTLVAALTLGPAVLALLSRRGYAEPRGDEKSLRRWHRIGTSVVRWPVPVLAASLAVLAVAIAPLAFYAPSYNERKAQPSDSPANLGFTAADRHLAPNVMAPSVLIVESDHDMRNPADLIALAKMTDSVASIRGIDAVQGITRPLARPLDQGTLTNQIGYIGNRFTQMTTLLKHRIADLDSISTSLDELNTAVDGLADALAQGNAGAAQLASASQRLSTTTDTTMRKVDGLSRSIAPTRKALGATPQCRQNRDCRQALAGLSALDDLPALRSAIAELSAGAGSVSRALPTASQQIPVLRSALGQARAVIKPLKGTLSALLPQTTEITDFIDEVSKSFAAGSPGSFFFLPSQALESPLFKSGMPYFFSADGKVTRMVVTPEVEGFSREAMDISAEVIPAATSSLKGTSLAGSTVSIGGPGGTLLNIESFAHEDFIAIVVAAFAFVFCVVLLLLRSLVAAIAVIGTVTLSYLAAMGVSVAVWQGLLGHPLHWSVTPIAFSFLVAVGADYNMLLVSRFREEYGGGGGTGLIRAMVGTGSVVTTAGITFGVTMLAMLASDARNVGQIGTTVALGLLIDTLIIRSLVMPAVARLCGRWFWWPTKFFTMESRTSNG